MEQQTPSAGMVHEAVGVFADLAAFEQTTRDLLIAGFDYADISLLAHEETVRHRLGQAYQDTHLATDDADAPRAVWVDPDSRAEGRGALAGVLAYVGAVGGMVSTVGSGASMALAATAVGASVLGSLGYGLGRLIDARLTGRMRANLDHGGVVVWVRAADADHALRARELLKFHGAGNVHLHQCSRSSCEEVSP